MSDKVNIDTKKKQKKSTRAKSRSPESFRFPYKDRAAYNATTVSLEEELRGDKAPNWKPKAKVTSAIGDMGPVSSLLYARVYDNHLNRALISKPFVAYDSNKKESKIRSHIIKSLAEPVTIHQITAALGIEDDFFSLSVKLQRIQAKNASFDIFMRSAGRLLHSRFEDVTANTSFADVFPNLVDCGILTTGEKPNPDIGNIAKNHQPTRVLLAYVCNMEASRLALNAWTTVQSNPGTKTVAPLIDPVSEQYINLLDIIFRKIETMIVTEKVLGKMYMGYKQKRQAMVASNVKEIGNDDNPVIFVLPTKGPLVDVMLTGLDICFYRWQMLASGKFQADPEILELAQGTMEVIMKAQKRKAANNDSLKVVKKLRPSTPLNSTEALKPAAIVALTPVAIATIASTEDSETVAKVVAKPTKDKKRKDSKSKTVISKELSKAKPAVEKKKTVGTSDDFEFSDVSDGTNDLNPGAVPVTAAATRPTLSSLHQQAVASDADDSDADDSAENGVEILIASSESDDNDDNKSTEDVNEDVGDESDEMEVVADSDALHGEEEDDEESVVNDEEQEV